MYYRQRGAKRYGWMSYVLPFLIIICVGFIAVLVFNLWQSIFNEKPTGDAYMHIESGSVQMKTWNSDSFLNLSSDATVIEGDEIKTAANAKVIIEFFDGTIMRVSGGSYFVVQGVSEGDAPKLEFLLVNGKLWFNKLYKNTGSTEIVVTLDDVVVNSSSVDIFEVENDFDEIVRILHGEKVLVDVLGQGDGKKIIETEEVGVGQEVTFNDKVLEKYWQYQSPSVLTALSDEFKASDWYLWNDQEDKSPTKFNKIGIMGEKDQFVEVKPEVVPTEVEVPAKVDGEAVVVGDDTAVVEPKIDVSVTDEPEVPVVDLGPLTKPTITSVEGITQVNENGFYVVTSSLATLTGTISGADKVVVSGYTLTKFKSGDKSWTYYANADYALMQAGENIYEIYALGANGEKSEALTVKVLYNPPAPVVAPVPTENPVSPEGGNPPADAASGTPDDGNAPID